MSCYESTDVKELLLLGNAVDGKSTSILELSSMLRD